MRDFWNRMKGIRFHLVTAIILFFVVFVIIITTLLPISKNIDTPAGIQTPTPVPPIDRLEANEAAYPTAKPQPTEFYKDTPTGTLVVTSNIDNTLAFVVNATEKDSHGAHEDEYSTPIPMNTTPFYHTGFPAGSYFMRGLKEGYVSDEKTFTIKEGEVTRIHLTLKPR